ncbi:MULTISPECIES: sigma-70 family RNA polymerase sigma factor [Herpetosiphon]|uniref:RNA polymerase subunit sigma-24 n=1 Tax=Herpetosiphon geysericola TaxID=70996 RepID=A0A0P6Y7W8_9CHLR|nr:MULTISPECIES: sigma-70 family RNA polymerase sigma factor [Herpetosiphon]KPL85925.1 RNA polymerase subunit sigma-24 [Herpetosiphon geysericola]MBM7843225.1 RNA polymerase sigma-70 factor (ECF subfamily) [Herpetosiphon giganteus]
MTEINSEELTLVRATIRGDQIAFQRIVELYQGPIFNLAYRMLHDGHEAEDAAQEIFIRAYTKLETFDQSRKFSTWLFSVASNYCIDRLRRRRPIVPLDDLAFALPSTDDGPERSALRGELRDAVQRALATLPDHYRLVAVLRYWNDLSYQEIENITGLSESAVKTRLHRARNMVAAALDKQGAEL